MKDCKEFNKSLCLQDFSSPPSLTPDNFNEDEILNKIQWVFGV